MALDPVSPVNARRYNEALRATEKINSGSAPPASAYLQREPSRAATDSAQVLQAATLPTGDGLFSIGNVAVKVVREARRFVRGVGSSWGF